MLGNLLDPKRLARAELRKMSGDEIAALLDESLPTMRDDQIRPALAAVNREVQRRWPQTIKK